MYKCSCTEKCAEKGKTLCTITIKSRPTSCKYCRYQKCLKLAGLVPKWVVSQYIPKVERRKKDFIKSPSHASFLGIQNPNFSYREVRTILIDLV